MWMTFFFAVALGAVFLYVPGALLLRSVRVSWALSLACAPFLMMTVYALLAIVYQKAGIFCDWTVLFVPSLIVGVAAFAASSALRLRSRAASDPQGCAQGPWWDRHFDVLCLVLYVVVGACIGSVFFVRGLGAPEAVMQAFDNVHHLGEVRGFVETGNWSSLAYSIYPTAEEQAFDPFPGTAFYPSAWHAIAAMMISAVGVGVEEAVNAANFLFAFVVLPASTAALMGVLFEGRCRVILWGSLCTVAFAAFPWAFLTFGPLYPNLASFALLPAVMGVFILVFAEGASRAERVRSAVLFFIGLLSLALSQPNAVFTGAVFLIPFCCVQSMRLSPRFSLGKTRPALMKAILCIAFLLVALVIWTALFKAPFLQGVVTHAWAGFAGYIQAFMNVLMLSYRGSNAQLFLGVLVLAGAVYTLYRRKYLWITCSYAIMCVFYLVCAREEGFIRFFLTGFWYTDPYRIAASAALFAVPLAAMGAHCFARLIGVALSGIASVAKCGNAAVKWSLAIAAVIFALAVFYPNFTVPGLGDVQTGFGGVLAQLKGFYSADDRPNIYDSAEQEFVREAMELIPEDAVVVNEPNDGSAFAYGMDGLNVMYRYMRDYGGREQQNSVLLRGHLDELAENEDVRRAVDELGAEYVLLLDAGDTADAQPHLFSYDPPNWLGITGVEDAPGFELLLSRDDMRLYRILPEEELAAQDE